MIDVIDSTPSVEAALQNIYRADLGTADWLVGLRGVLSPDASAPSAAMMYELLGRSGRVRAISASTASERFLRGISASADDAIALPAVPPQPCSLLYSAMDVEYPPHETFAGAFAQSGFRDVWAVGGTSVCGVGVVVGLMLRNETRLSRRASRYWSAVATHMSAAVRLRTAMHAPTEAVLSRDGKVLHAEGIARDEENRESLRRAAKAIDRARRGVDDAVLAIESCSAMVEGRWTLVDEFESDGRRHLIARVNEPKTPDYAGLSLRERQVVALAMNGRATKQIAYELGIAVPTVASYLRRSLRKLGARSRLELVAKAAYFSIL